VYVISIPTSTRKNDLKKNFKLARINNYEIIDFQPASKIVNDGSEKDLNVREIMQHNFCDSTCQNITNNHLEIIKKAYQLNLNNVLIFEDDAYFELPLDLNKIRNIVDWLKISEWDMFFFGYIPYPIPLLLPVSLDVVRVFTPMLGHAYAVNKSGINYIINNLQLFSNKHIDSVYSSLPLKKYGVWGNVCFQSSDPALYTRAMQKVGLNISLKTFSKINNINFNYNCDN
jgi:hypothetical protein